MGLVALYTWDLNSLTRDWTRVPCFAWLFLTTGPPSKCQVQSFELNYPTSQAPWGCIKEISSFGRRIIVIWPPWSCISTDLAVIMCIYQLDVPAPKHLLFFVGWLSGYIQIFEQFEWKIWQGKKMVTSNLGKHTVLLFSVEEFSLIWLLWPAEPYSYCLHFPWNTMLFHASRPLHMQVILFATLTLHLFCLFSSSSAMACLKPTWPWGAVRAFLNVMVLCFPLSLPLLHRLVVVYLSVSSDYELPEAHRSLEKLYKTQVCTPGAWNKMDAWGIFAEWKNNESVMRAQKNWTLVSAL